MRLPSFASILLVLAAFMALTVGTSTALAHERRAVGADQFVVGFLVEPPVEGENNGVDLRVSTGDPAKPVVGMEKTLKVEVSQGTSTRMFDLRALFNDPGHYAANFIPTAPGQYAFRFVGNIEGMPVDERFLSGPGRFNDVQSAQDLQFPDKLPALREVSGVTRATQQTAQEASEAASSLRKIAISGVVLGVMGMALGVGAAMLSFRRR